MCGFLGRAPVDEISVDHPRHIAVTADMTSGTWNTKATHEVFTVTGLVRVQMWVQIVTPLDSTGGSALVAFGVESLTELFMGAMAEDAFIANRLWDYSSAMVYDTTVEAVQLMRFNAVQDWVIYGEDVGYEITGEPLTSGSLVFHCVWAPLSVGATVTAGDGSAL